MSFLFNKLSRFYDAFMEITGLSNESLLLDHIGDLEGLKVADVGGGTGTLAKIMHHRNAEVTVIDPSTPMTQIALKKCPGLKIINASAENISVENNYFNVVCMRDCLHHIRSKQDTVKEAARILKQGGRIVIQEFRPSSVVSKFIYVFERSLGEKTVLVEPEELVEMMKCNGIHGQTTNVSSFEYVFSGVKEWGE
ncbi:Methyltransferase type 11 [Pseudobacteroides cellulosolvens ATCC 35603 = DSM 2933]|uniref:Methyltransferase type 11 n=2 Tax=Pseudobacteroides cellulosolvens TaxID=35825 RepID=A0A0L6JMA1_9FIRM|nr:Methyltransferase type 11 [Pseudobacteroides cellulosolvens ATCC 35603 = DSM 2933]